MVFSTSSLAKAFTLATAAQKVTAFKTAHSMDSGSKNMGIAALELIVGGVKVVRILFRSNVPKKRPCKTNKFVGRNTTLINPLDNICADT